MAKKDKKLRPDAELQTDVAQMTATGRVIAEHPSTFITPQKMRSLFEEAETGDITAQHELFADIEERDSDIGANMGTRKRALLTLDWRVSPPRNATAEEEKLTEAVFEMMDGLAGFDDLLIDLMDAVGHGFAALEIEWRFSDGLYLPHHFIHRPQGWFRWSKDDELLLKTPDNPMGAQLWPLGWIVHSHKSRSVQQARNGLFRSLAWLYMFKHYAIHDFAEFLELYGMPIRIGKYGAGATKEEKRTLLRAVAEIGHNAAGIMPEGMEIELHNVANGTTATSNPFLQMADWCEKSAARLILGQTLTSGADGKSSTNALGMIHNEVRRDLLVSDAKQIAQTITQQIILPFLQVNFGDTSRTPRFEFDTREAADIAVFAEALPKLVDVGVQIPEGWVRDKLVIPEAAEGEKVLSRVVTDNPINRTALAALSAQRPSETRAISREQATLDAVSDEAFAQPDFNAQLNPIIRQAVAALAACGSYEEADAALTALYPELDNRELEIYMRNALFLSDLLGQANVKN
ncbi:DUF935 domain-containing protein [Neisseria sp. DTU_2021_1001991_1_SI_NGA_ILE_055]|uniref:DUF935 domain-containing protein n=1 Tax=Neisseria sp. DTU_2021_1001991_1_SI_NGA_ILE_055 TaxID=3077590 RepID=UPI0028F076C1|nr:DUF935 family protein [Neisseria sp. DTU_2021_1001991_1_SI_NGA_ILE_055]WNS83242.1 DUF935 family protein [Neisseria sp. DTU_2021_1001991_1_SI_NGA_ILE_055]